jgi:MFS family permease
VAQGWLVYELTGSPTWLGVISFASGIPILVLSLPAGVLVDRFDRRLMLILAQGGLTLIAVILAILIAANLVQAWQVAIIAFAAGCMFVLAVPARVALMPASVPRSQLGAAVALQSIAQNSGRVVGPSLTGVLIAAFGVATSFAAQAGAFLLALLCSVLLKPAPVGQRSRERSAIQDLQEGLRYVWRDPTVLALVALQAIPSMLLMPYVQLLPIFARDILQAGPEGLGTLMTAGGIGSVLGAIGMVLLQPRQRGLLLFGSLAALGLLLAMFSASTSLALSILLMGIIGVAQAVYFSTSNTLVQVAVPDALQGRVMSVYMVTWGLQPLGSLPQGVLADWFGAPIVLAGAGLLSCLIVAIIAARSAAIRRL